MAGGGDKRRSRTLTEMAAAEAQPAPDFRADDKPAPEVQKWLPPDSPVIPLGVLGKNLVFLDRLQQIVVTAPDCRKGELKLWFGHNWLTTHFEALDKNGNPTGTFNQDKPQTALVEDCVARGPFDPQGKVLGRGAHAPLGDPEALVLHMGTRVLLANLPDSSGQRGLTIKTAKAGMVQIGGKDTFFPAAPPLPPPDKSAAKWQEGEAVLELYESWNWVEPDAGPLLMLGHTAQSYICGALGWRAHVLLTGPTATGKTTLQKHYRALMDDWVVATADATEAGIRQKLNNDTLPISLDEFEAHDNPERVAAVLNLIKKASSGDMIVKGGADHKGQQFTAQSCFLASCVIHPTLRGEDRNRIAVLELRPLAQQSEPLEMEYARWRSTGRRLHRRMIEQWPRFERTLAAYKRAIGAQRFEGRWQDTYGTLLACADLLLYDFAPDSAEASKADASQPGMSRVHEAVAKIIPLLVRGRTEARSDTDRVTQYLASHILPGANGNTGEPVGVWLDRALLPAEIHDAMSQESFSGPNQKARDKLKSHGMRVVRYDPTASPMIADARMEEVAWGHDYLAIAYPSNKGITEIFQRSSDWAGDGYRQSFAKLEGVISPVKVRFGGKNSDNAVLVPLRHFKGDEG